MAKDKKKEKPIYKTKIQKKKFFRKSFKKLYRKLPNIFYFNINSKFIFDTTDRNIYQKFNTNLNMVKPNLILRKYLKDKIEELEFALTNEKNENFISIPKSVYESIIKFKNFKPEKTEIEKFILKQIKNNPDRSKLSCRKLASLYTEESGKTIHKSQMNNIMRKKVGLHYIKTSLKNNKINSTKNILYSFCFIRIILRAIKLGFKILFQDETSILNSNNNYRCWRFEGEKIFTEGEKKMRKNLLLLIGEDSIINYKFNNESTNEETFLEFMKESKDKIDKSGIESYIIIMDNLSAHKTSVLMNFYEENNMNVVFNSPYCSYFNCIELAFRSIKSILYKKVYNNIQDVETEVKNIMSKPIFKETLKANYKETLCEYQKFLDLNGEVSLNNICL